MSSASPPPALNALDQHTGPPLPDAPSCPHPTLPLDAAEANYGGDPATTSPLLHQAHSLADLIASSADDNRQPIHMWAKTHMSGLRTMGDILGVNLDVCEQPLQILESDLVAYQAERNNFGIADPSALLRINPSTVTETTQLCLELGLDTLMASRMASLKFRGDNAEIIQSELAALAPTVRETVMDILTTGQRRLMKPTFTPNGGYRFRQSRSYNEGTLQCNHAIEKQNRKGETLILWWDQIPPDIREQLHVSPLERVPKVGKPEGRTCLNLSSGKKLSFNEQYDEESSNAYYIPHVLPNLRSVSEVACNKRDHHQVLGGQLSGATADVDSAYNRIVQTVESAKLHCTIVDVDGRKALVVYLVAVFGAKRTGAVYDTVGQAMSSLHNLGQEVTRSLTYVDDAIIVDIAERAEESLQDYLKIVRSIFGENGISVEKVNRYEHTLEAIGWRWDFANWTVGPRRRGIMKLLDVTFYLFRPTDSKAKKYAIKDIQTLAGVLTYYAAAIPMAQSFVTSIYQCIPYGLQYGSCVLSAQAREDLNWFRHLILLVALDHSPFLASIDHVRSKRIPNRMLVTDASTGVGCGAWLAYPGEPSTNALQEGWLRWTQDELLGIQEVEGSINILEYFTVIYFVMLWADELRGCIVHVKCDNTSAIAWIQKARTNSKNVHLFNMARAFTVVCLRMGIQIIIDHIPGIDNVYADYLSRAVSLQEETIADGIQSSNISRATVCRKLLKTALTQDLNTPLLDLLDLVNELLSSPGSATSRQ
jgi:hypothetical protein